MKPIFLTSVDDWIGRSFGIVFSLIIAGLGSAAVYSAWAFVLSGPAAL